MSLKNVVRFRGGFISRSLNAFGGTFTICVIRCALPLFHEGQLATRVCEVGPLGLNFGIHRRQVVVQRVGFEVVLALGLFSWLNFRLDFTLM